MALLLKLDALADKPGAAELRPRRKALNKLIVKNLDALDALAMRLAPPKPSPADESKMTDAEPGAEPAPVPRAGAKPTEEPRGEAAGASASLEDTAPSTHTVQAPQPEAEPLTPVGAAEGGSLVRAELEAVPEETPTESVPQAIAEPDASKDGIDGERAACDTDAANANGIVHGDDLELPAEQAGVAPARADAAEHDDDGVKQPLAPGAALHAAFEAHGGEEGKSGAHGGDAERAAVGAQQQLVQATPSNPSDESALPSRASSAGGADEYVMVDEDDPRSPAAQPAWDERAPNIATCTRAQQRLVATPPLDGDAASERIGANAEQPPAGGAVHGTHGNPETAGVEQPLAGSNADSGERARPSAAHAAVHAEAVRLDTAQDLTAVIKKLEAENLALRQQLGSMALRVGAAVAKPGVAV